MYSVNKGPCNLRLKLGLGKPRGLCAILDYMNRCTCNWIPSGKLT